VALGVLLATLWAGWALAAAGQLDHSFSSDGRQLTRFPGTTGSDGANAVVVDRSGRIVVAGDSQQAGGEKFAVARYKPDGSLDHTFSGDGRQLTRFPGATGFDRAEGLAIDRSGRIVVAGFSQQGAGPVYKFAIARYNADGSLDHTFSGDGRQLTRFPGATGFDEAYAVAIDHAGRILLAGYSAQSGGNKFALARYNPSGSLDHGFSSDGRQLTRFPGSNGTQGGQANAVAIDASGRIVAAGRSVQTGLVGKLALARYTPNGSLDHSFSSDGRQLTRFPGATGNDLAHGVAIQANGRIVVAGISRQGAGADFKFALARYNPNGALDHSFSSDGRQLTRFPGSVGDDEALGMAIEKGGRIVAAGASQQTAGYKFALARYNSNGSLDHSFSSDGRQLTGFPGAVGDDEATAMAIDRSGRSVAAGYSQQAAGYKFALARYLAG
jgi:uncharacterized delta-60 repeat protein